VLCAFCFEIKKDQYEKTKSQLHHNAEEAILDKRPDTYEFRVRFAGKTLLGKKFCV